MRSHFKFFQTFSLLFCIHSCTNHAHPCINSSSSLGSADIFNDSLEIDRKMNQQSYSLNLTGISYDNSMPSINPNKTLPIHAISHYAFLSDKPKWDMMNLTYSFEWNVRKEAKLAFQLALNEWASATPFKFYQVKNFSRANIKFSFVSGDHGDGFPFGGTPGELAHCFPPPDGRIHFNNHQNWSWTGKKKAFDVQTAGLHELGHALGLGHSRVSKAVMYPVLYPGAKKGLHKDDVDGIKALYKMPRR